MPARPVAAALLLLVAAVHLPAAAPASTVGPGDRVPAASLTDRDGRAVSLADFRGRTVVVDFWASWCMVCRAALPALDALARRQPGDGAVVLAVNVDRSRAAADAWLAEHLPSTALRVLYDPEGDLLARFGASGMPAIYVIDPEGTVRVAESGYAPERVEAVGRAIEAMRSPAPPS